MPTTKLGLPTISDNMTTDVVRDTNALAQAVDDKAGVASGLALLNSSGKVIKADGTEITPEDIGSEPAFTKNNAFNKSFGASAGTVTEGNDSRLSDPRTPKAHASTHTTGGSDPLTPGDIDAEPAFAKNTAFNKNFSGSGTATTVSRSDHNHSGTYEPTFTKNSAFNKNFGGNGTATTVARSDHTHPDMQADIDNLKDYQVIKSNKDSNGVFTTVQHKRKSDGSLFLQSVLSGGTSPQYTTRTETYYDTDGTTVLKTVTYTLTYDADGDLISEV